MDISGEHSVVVCVGSNAPDRMRRLDEACALLENLLPGCRFTLTIETSDASGHTDSRYANRLCFGISGTADYESLNRVLKDYEREQRRYEAGEVVDIDLDIVIFDGTVKRRGTFDAPYFQYLYADLV